MTGFIDDPLAAKRSLMKAKGCICTGQQTGRKCKFYWRLVRSAESHNPDNLKDGERVRICMRPFPGFEGIEMDEDKLPLRCSEFVPLKRPWWKPWGEDKGVFNPHEEEYIPLKPEEIRKLQAVVPSDPVRVQTPYAAITELQNQIQNDLQTDLAATGRRSLHENLPPHEDGCPNPSFCSCQCAVCLKAQMDAGKPSPLNPRPEDLEQLKPAEKVSFTDAMNRLKIKDQKDD